MVLLLKLNEIFDVGISLKLLSESEVLTKVVDDVITTLKEILVFKYCCHC